VHVNIWTPQKLSAEEKAMLEKLREAENFKPHPGKNDKGFFYKYSCKLNKPWVGFHYMATAFASA
jgi:DnaJ-class molecular chaperone